MLWKSLPHPVAHCPCEHWEQSTSSEQNHASVRCCNDEMHELCRRHPTADRPLIDWDLIMVMEPMTILGAVLGGFLNKMLPVWLTTVLLTMLLAFVSYNLWRKAATMYHKECVAQQDLAVQRDSHEEAESYPVVSCRSACLCAFEFVSWLAACMLSRTPSQAGLGRVPVRWRLPRRSLPRQCMHRGCMHGQPRRNLGLHARLRL
jgi:hypothetical protein